MGRKFLHLSIFFTFLTFLFYTFYGCYNKKSYCFLSVLNLSIPITHDKLQQDNSYFTKSEKIDTPISILTLALISDSHLNRSAFPILKVSLSQFSPDLLIHAGDLTDFGTIKDLELVKSDLDSLDIKYYALPGDHDIAQTSSEENFNKVFSSPNLISINNVNILLIKNEFNFTPMDDTYLNSILNQIPKADVIILSQPIFVPDDNIFSVKYMGSSEAFENLSEIQIQNLKTLKTQRDKILSVVRESATTKIIISGDHHRSSTYQDPVNKKVSYHVLGGLSEYIYFGGSKISQNSLQSKRYSILKVLKKRDSNRFDFKIQEIELK